MISYVGISKNSTYSLQGQIEMLTYCPNKLTINSTNNYLNNIEIISSINEYDSLDLLKCTSKNNYGKQLINSKYEYKEILDNGDVRVIPDMKDLTISYKEKVTNEIVEAQKIYSYEYENNGNIDKISVDGLEKYNYVYDSLNRLKKEINKQDMNSYISYSYDNNGNIKSKFNSSTNIKLEFEYHHNTKDRLVSIKKNDVNIKRLEYLDSLYSNPTFFGVGQGEDKNGIFYTWEGRRLVNLYDNIKKINIEYQYDYQSRRIKKIITDKNQTPEIKISEIDYLYDGDNLVSERDLITNDAKYYLYDQSNRLIAIKYNGNSYYYIRELTGNIIGLIDDSGVVVLEYEYDAFGNVVNITGSHKESIGKINPFIYKGYYYDFETSIYYCKTRFYVPEWCRWLNADSVDYLDLESLNGLNLYVYCGNNPIMFYDPSGKFLITTAMITGAIIGAIIGFASVYVPDVVENIKDDGFQVKDLWTFNKDNLIKYAASTFGGALTGFIGGSGISVFIAAPLIGATNTGAGYLAGDIKTWDQAKTSFIATTLLSGLTLGSHKLSKLYTSKNPIVSKGLNTTFNRVVEKTIYGIEKTLYYYGKNSDIAVSLTVLGLNIRKEF